MRETKPDPIDRLIDALKHALQLCDAEDVGQTAALHIDMALHMAKREQAAQRTRD